MPRIRLQTLVPAPVAACFDLSLSVDAHTASMARSRERAIGPVTSGVLGPGESVTWRARHFGIPFTMTSRIVVHEPPHRFVDQQVSGPFAHWWHEHRFEAHDAGTLMTDLVEYASPLGPLGRVVDRLVLTSYLARLLTVRNEWIAGHLGRVAD
ncbi:SRPBCC family protein [Occultella gossypii]|uniref:SRPBCC family protein n=1 Tax=Occultella gossypii TaxID=2800820 RepID=A0ABS7S4S3_9MICO|nr:SRPBCC family protein [Occultella gossypii]MBZ2194908.1 SRPBCC family protein [Occultella gossypii]